MLAALGTSRQGDPVHHAPERGQPVLDAQHARTRTRTHAANRLCEHFPCSHRSGLGLCAAAISPSGRQMRAGRRGGPRPRGPFCCPPACLVCLSEDGAGHPAAAAAGEEARVAALGRVELYLSRLAELAREVAEVQATAEVSVQSAGVAFRPPCAWRAGPAEDRQILTLDGVQSESSRRAVTLSGALGSAFGAETLMGLGPLRQKSSPDSGSRADGRVQGLLRIDRSYTGRVGAGPLPGRHGLEGTAVARRRFWRRLLQHALLLQRSGRRRRRRGRGNALGRRRTRWAPSTTSACYGLARGPWCSIPADLVSVCLARGPWCLSIPAVLVSVCQSDQRALVVCWGLKLPHHGSQWDALGPVWHAE
jgi:hypothetical protein